MKFTGEFFIPADSDDKFSNHELQIEHKHRYYSIATLARDKTVLDLASGEGYGTHILAGYAARVYGVDINPELVAHASAKYGGQNASFLTGSVDSIPLPDNSVDMIVSFETIEHVSAELQTAFLAEVKRVLKEDGLFIISTPNKKNYTDRYDYHNEFHVHELYKEEFTRLLRTFFPHVNLFDQGFEVSSLILNKEGYQRGLPLSVFKIEDNAYHFEGKYLIALCSGRSEKTQHSLSSVIPESERSYYQLIDNIIKLQNEIEVLGAWGRRSNEELEEAKQKFTALHSQYEQLKTDQATNSAALEETVLLREQLQEKVKEINILNERVNELSFQNEKYERNIQQYFKANYALKKELKNKSDLFEKLASEKKDLESHQIYKLEAEKKELESRLKDIYSSDGYKLLAIYYRFKGKYLPENSSKHLKLKAFGKFLKSKNIFPKLRGKIPPVSVSASTLVRDYNVIPEVPANIRFPLVFPIVDKPLVSIIIPAYNNWAFTRNCLISIYEYTKNVPYEIIVGDNVSIDETVNFEKYFTNVTYLRNPENLGYIRNINNAAKYARGQFILTLNNDTTVTEHWLSSMVDVMNRDEKAGLVGSKLVFPDGTLQEAGGIIWKDASAWNYGRDGNPDAPEYNYVKEVDYISGASNLIRKELWEKLKGLDERYVPAYFDDSDLAMGIRSLGYKVIYQPLSVVIHYEGLTHGTSTSGGTKKYQQVNLIKFVEKWKAELTMRHLENSNNVFYARDRSSGKKTIVVIDHYVPQFDKDGGSRTVFQYLNLFVNIGLNVKFIGDNFYRHEPYTTILQQKGIEVLIGSYYMENWMKWLKNNDQYIDFIFLNRPHISIKYIDFIKNEMHGKIFYYMHDLHFVREMQEYQITKDEKKLALSEQWKQTEYSLFSKSDVVLTPSIKEREILAPDFPSKPIAVMPAFFYPSIPDPIKNFNERKDILFVGGFGHEPNIDAMLWFAGEVFPLIRQKNKEIRLIIVGSLAPEKISRLASQQIIVKGFVTDEELENIYGKIRFSIVPLRYGAGVKGKTVESLSKGIPVISTSFGIEGLQDIEIFLHPYDTADDFAEAVVELYSDIQRLENLSSLAVEYAKKYFTSESASLFFKTLFNL